MDDQTSTVRTWQEAGVGIPPAIWALRYWPSVASETKFLTPPQYWYVADQLEELAREPEPCKSKVLDVSPIEEFWELKDKGGLLGKINLRVFFATNPAVKEIVVLGVHKKEDERQLRRSVIVRIERRLRLYLAA